MTMCELSPPKGVALWQVTANRGAFYFYGMSAFEAGHKAAQYYRKVGWGLNRPWTSFRFRMAWDTGIPPERFDAKREIIEPLGYVAYQRLKEAGSEALEEGWREETTRERKSMVCKRRRDKRKRKKKVVV